MSYYIIVPSKVRYDNRLKPAEKLIYGEVLALSNKTNYCFASNRYFAELYGVSPITISIWINELIEYGYLKAEYITSEGSEYSTRRLYITDRSILDFDEEVDVPTNNYKKTKEVNSDVEHIVSYLNEICGSRFKSTTSSTVKCIKARLKEGFSLQDFEKVIRWKYFQWGEKPFRFSGGQLSSDYLRPTTLFSDKFESYLYEANNNTNYNSEAVRSVPPDEERSELVF